MTAGDRFRWSTTATAARSGTTAAIVAEGLVLSWADVAERVARWRGWLDAAGAGGNLALVGERTPAVVTLMMAVIESGRRAVLLHPRWSAAEVARSLEQGPDSMIIESCNDAWRAAVKAAPVRGTPPGDGSVVVFTSGSTGTASGVELSSRVLAASARASAHRLGWTTDDRWLCCLPLAHVGGLSIVTRCWQGARTIVLEPEGRFDPERLASHLQQHHVTLLSLVPTQLRALLDDRGWTPPGGLRAVLVGGAASSDDLLAEASDRGLPIRPTYGLTEAASQVATWPPDTPWAPGHGVGPPLPGVEVTIREDERIAVRGAMVDPCEFPGGAALTDEDGWLVTGDRGRIDGEGWLHVLGRVDDVIVTGGENVDPRSVEAALERSPGVVAACVVGIPDPVWGEVVAALVETRDERALDGLERRLEGDLAPHARPRRIVRVAALPVTATGKPDRRAAAAILNR